MHVASHGLGSNDRLRQVPLANFPAKTAENTVKEQRTCLGVSCTLFAGIPVFFQVVWLVFILLSRPLLLCNWNFYKFVDSHPYP